MAGPWEKYAAQSVPAEDGPWAKYAAAAPEPITRTDKVIKGLRDQVDGGAQLLTKMLPDSVVNAGNQFNNWLADKTGLIGKLPEGGVDQQVREGEQAYQAKRAAAGESGFDGYRVLGNVLSPANLAMAARIPAAATAVGGLAIGGATGAVSGALTPVAEGQFLPEKAKQIGMGAAFGAGTSAATNALARVISPAASQNPNLQLLQQEGVTPTIGQTLGGRFNALEEKLQSIPILGDAISNARGNALKDFNTAAINRASGHVGEKVEGVGQGAVREAGDAISKTYDAALSQVRAVPLDAKFSADLTQLRGMAQNLVPGMRDKFNKTLDDVVMGRVSPQGSILGSTYKDVDSELGNIASRYGKSQVASEQEFGDAVAQVQNLLRQQMMRTNPQVADKLQAADAGWANLVRIEGAAKAAKNAEGVFTPAQLNAAVQAADDSVRKRAVSRGNALLQDLGNAGQSVLGNKVPNSFTTDRALLAGGTLGSYLVNPMIPAGLLGGAALYSRPAQVGLNALASARPQAAQPVANALQQYAPALLPLGAQVGLGLNK